MKKTLVDKIPNKVSQNMQHLIAGTDIYDSSSSPEARVYFTDEGSGYYLKRTRTGTLEKETKIMQHFHFKKLGTEVLNHTSNDHDWLLTKAVIEHDCVDNEYLNHPKRLYDMTATELRRLHKIDYSDCPVMSRAAEYSAEAEDNCRTGNYDKLSSPNSFGCRSAEQTHEVLTAGRGTLQNQVLLHGDYCLPNIILDNWKFPGSIDFDYTGVGDHHIDSFWRTWILWFDLKTSQYRDRFSDIYGRDKIDEELPKAVAAIEAFG